MTSRQTQVIMLLLWRQTKWLPFFRSAPRMNSFTVKSSKKHQSRERPPAYIITAASGPVSPISYSADIKKHATEKDQL